MAQVKCIEPTKMKNTALALYKNSMAKHESVRNEAQTSTYLCWATMSMLVEQAMADPDMNDEDCFTPIAKNPPPAKNKLQKCQVYQYIKNEETNFDCRARAGTRSVWDIFGQKIDQISAKYGFKRRQWRN